MKLRVRNLKVELDHQDRDILSAVNQRLGLKSNDILTWKKVKKSIDARRSKIYFNYSVEIDLNENDKILKKLEKPDLDILFMEEKESDSLESGTKILNTPPVIVGTGPAGLFTGLLLARHNYRPILIEQGEDIDNRVNSVESFWKLGVLNPRSNTQFGEGGAGSFSDGKLTTRIGDHRIDYVLQCFVKAGANEEILYEKKPHLGTDLIRSIVKRIREEIISLGGQVYFNAKLSDIEIHQGALKSIIINKQTKIDCSVLILALGNSARDTFRLLDNRLVPISSKAFALGVRIEHPQEKVDRAQYGEYAGHPKLGAADYQLSYQDRESKRSFYSFCMCPGGYVIAASSDKEQVVTNGMSYSARDSGIANSALVVSVSPADWDNEKLGGIKLQESLEKKAFQMGQGKYFAPVQNVSDFLEKTASHSIDKKRVSYKPGVVGVNLWELFPQDIAETMRRGITAFSQKMNFFEDSKAVLTAVETRTSSPVRIDRNSDSSSTGVEGLYPCGEGAGYAGGIMSAAVDGLKTAESIIRKYKKPESIIEVKDSEAVDARRLSNI